MWVFRNDNKRHVVTKVITLLITFLTFFIFIKGYRDHCKRIAKLSNKYDVQIYKCQDCIHCEVELLENETFELKQKGQLIDSGNWTFEDIQCDGMLLQTNIFFDGQKTWGNQYETHITISYIKNEACR